MLDFDTLSYCRNTFTKCKTKPNSFVKICLCISTNGTQQFWKCWKGRVSRSLRSMLEMLEMVLFFFSGGGGSNKPILVGFNDDLNKTDDLNKAEHQHLGISKNSQRSWIMFDDLEIVINLINLTNVWQILDTVFIFVG